jgi:PPM family protein phosphatase
VEIEVWVATERSARHEANEDRAVAGGEVFAEATSVEHRTLSTPTLLAALDGLGGHAAGDVASDLAAKLLAAAEVPADTGAAGDLLQLADRTLHDAMAADPNLHGMGATVAAVAVHDGALVAANAGDATAWRLDGQRFEPLAITDRMGGSGVLQCLGAFDGIQPHARRVELRAGDRLLLASDGLTDVVPPEAIEAYLREDVAGAAEQLLRAVERAGRPDDVTIVVAEVRDAS